MTPPTARRHPTAASAGDVLDRRRFIGADRLAHPPGDRVRPAGVTHVVDGWQPVCGQARVRFVFPGASLDDAAEVCADCAASTPVRKVPRPRQATTSA